MLSVFGRGCAAVPVAIPNAALNIERTWDEGRYTRAKVLRELLRTQILAAKHSGWPAVRAADQC